MIQTFIYNSIDLTISSPPLYVPPLAGIQSQCYSFDSDTKQLTITITGDDLVIPKQKLLWDSFLGRS